MTMRLYLFVAALAVLGHYHDHGLVHGFVQHQHQQPHRSTTTISTSTSVGRPFGVTSTQTAPSSSSSSSSSSSLSSASTRGYSRHQAKSDSSSSSSFLFDDFKTYAGEVLNPYQVLKVPRGAERREIRQSYLALSKRYHPDVVRHKDILPGSCNNHDDVRDQWERIKLAYEILSDSKMRKRYDRHEVIADPKAAMQRAAWDATGSAVKGLGKGLFSTGKGLFDLGAKAMANNNSKNKEQDKNGEQKK